jgi:hypothetical protein
LAGLGRVCGAGSLLGRRRPSGERRRGDARGRRQEGVGSLGHGEGELPEALAAPIWGRYALFRGHPQITGLVMWDVKERQVLVAGERGGQKFDEVLSAPRPVRLAAMPAPPTTPRDTSPGPAAPADQQSSLPAGGAGEGTLRLCDRCGRPLPQGFVPRRATALSAAVRPPRAPGSGTSVPSLPPRRLRVAAGAAGRCPPVCARRPGSAQSAAGRRPRGALSRRRSKENAGGWSGGGEARGCCAG